MIVALTATDAREPLRVCVVSHTHWDREWYHGAARFRQRLIALVDAVLADIDRNESSEVAPFLLDGQAIVLRDYLAVRPEAQARVASALARGALEAGPWYVLADTLMPSGEALVRNLEAGRRVLRALGASPPPVAWCPDTFGHPAALPLLARGFGLDVAVVWRGLGGTQHPTVDTMSWASRDGTTIPTVHLPPDGYEVGSALPVDVTQALTRWRRLADWWAQRNTTGVVLLPNGADHHARQPDLAAALDALRVAAGNDADIVPMSLATWARLVQARLPVSLPVVMGELRDSYGYTWTLGGTLATRAHQKRANARLERGLLRDVEPWLALARLHDTTQTTRSVDAAGRLTMAQLPALLDATWEALLDTHPHDTLCGCSIDDVARRMDAQQERVAAEGRGLREAALQLALGHDVVREREHTDLSATRIVVRNRAARRRSGLAQLRIVETLAHVPVGPGSAGADDTTMHGGAPPTLGAWTVQWLGAPCVRYARRESPQHYPDNDRVAVWRALAWVPDVPASGVLAVDPTVGGDAAPRASEVPHAVIGQATTVGHATTQVTLDNDIAQCTVDATRGTVALTVRGRTLSDVLGVITRDDDGDSYTPAPRGAVTRLRLERATLLHAGPLRATVRCAWRTPRNEADVNAPRGTVRVITDLSLEAGATALQCHVRGVNARAAHRLQLIWRTDVFDGATEADAAFGPEPRVPIVAPDTTTEMVPPGMPMHRYVTHANAVRGATLVADGLAECEVQSTDTGALLALTLLRATGALSRGNLAERPGHAGWPAAIPDAQCMGPFRAHCALWLHGPLDEATRARRRDIVDDVLLPLDGESWRDLALDGSARTIAGPQLDGDAFECSAITVSQLHDDAIVLRAVNVTGARAAGSWLLPDDGPWAVTPCRLDETAEGGALTSGARIPFVAGPRGVVTLRVARAGLHPAAYTPPR